MEVKLKKENKNEVNEMISFIQSLSPEEKQAFKYIMYGFKAAKTVAAGKEVS